MMGALPVLRPLEQIRTPAGSVAMKARKTMDGLTVRVSDRSETMDGLTVSLSNRSRDYGWSNCASVQ